MSKLQQLFLFMLLLITVYSSVLQGSETKHKQGKPLKIKIISKNMTMIAILNNSTPSRELIKKLPITLTLQRHQNREYYTDILLAKDLISQDGYNIGDIAYWKTGNSLVLFYAKGYTSNLIKMGEIITGLENLGKTEHSLQVTIEQFKD